MRILVACEESQRVCIEFRKKGHEAYSCDIIDQSGGYPEWHIMADVLPLLNGDCKFTTTDGVNHEIVGRWDMIIAFPPCTYLTITGNKWFNVDRYGDKARERIEKRKEAADFFMKFINADCEKIAVENPIGYMSTFFQKPNQIIHPYMFGDPERKSTCLWLKGLKPLESTREKPLSKEERTQNIWKAKFNGKQYAWSDPEVARMRSVTPLGVAKAMADQWGKDE